MLALPAGWFSQNGNGEMTGTTWVEESGLMYGPVMITNTHSVGVVRDAVIGWALDNYDFDEDDWWSLPVVGETWDGWLNDLNGFHVKPEHAYAALDNAKPGPVQEGGVGGGTGMIPMNSRAESARLPGWCMTKAAITPWACWCNPTSVLATS